MSGVFVVAFLFYMGIMVDKSADERKTMLTI